MMGFGTVYTTLKYPILIVIAECLFLIRVKRKENLKAKSLVFFMCYFALAGLFKYISIVFGVQNVAFATSFRDIFLSLVTLIWIYWCYHINYLQAGFVLVSAGVAQSTAFFVQMIVTVLLNKIWTHHKFFMAYQVGLVIVVYGIVYFVLYLFFAKKVNQEKIQLQIQSQIGNTMLLMFGILIMQYFFYMYTKGFGTIQMIVFCAIPILYCAAVLGTFLKTLEMDKLRQDMKFIERLFEMKMNYYEQLKENIAMTNVKCHDFKHQLYQLRQRNIKSREDMEEALEDIEETIESYDSFAMTGNEAFDVVVTEKSMVCNREKIKFTCMADRNCLDLMKKKDIYSLFGNILDNAIEAVQKVDSPEKKIISLSVRKTDQIVEIQEYNYFEGEIHLEEGIPQTTKEDIFHHGYGVRSIRYIVGKYGGEMAIVCKNSIFRISIVVPVCDFPMMSHG